MQYLRESVQRGLIIVKLWFYNSRKVQLGGATSTKSNAFVRSGQRSGKTCEGGAEKQNSQTSTSEEGRQQ